MMQQDSAATVPAAGQRFGISKSAAVRFVVLLGVVSLFADTTYEGARSINGPYLEVLGASGLAVGIISGLGELVSYSLRLLSGYLSDKTHRYWAVAGVGYVFNLFAVPALALAGSWQLAGVLIVAERVGKGLRNPPRDAMLSHAGSQMGTGWGFGLHEAMDQTGATIGPLVVALIVYLQGDYKAAYAFLLIPAACAFLTLLTATRLYPRPRDFEPIARPLGTKGFHPAFWLYTLAGACVAMGFADFSLIAFRFQDQSVISNHVVPLYYAAAMVVAGAAGLLCGRLFDKIGISVMIAATIVASAFAPLAFLGNAPVAFGGVILWAIGLGAQETVLSAAIAPLVAAERRATAFGVFNFGFGIAWFAGSVVIGVLYDVSIPWLVAFSMAFQLAALPFFVAALRVYPRAGEAHA